MIFRPVQGGYTYRKLLYWVKSSNRFRFRAVLFLCVLGYPLRDFLFNFLGSAAFWTHFYFTYLFRPMGGSFNKEPWQVMHKRNKISELPPSRNHIKRLNDEESIYKLYVENEKALRFKIFNEVDIVRTRCLFAHPSRETNGVVEGEILRNEQDKIVEGMKVMMAEFGVSKGIWRDIGEAFKQGDDMERKKVREEFKRLVS